jgi:hypothetical protein
VARRPWSRPLGMIGAGFASSASATGSGFDYIGLAVVRDGTGLVWMTQDFVN